MTDEQEKYYRKLAQDAGFSEEQTKAVLEAIGNEKFGQGVVPRPEFSRGLDQERAKMKPLQDRVDYYEKDFYPKAKKAQDAYMAGVERLRLYEQTYGEIRPGQQARQAAEATGLSRDEVERLVQERAEKLISARDRMFLEFEEIRDSHRDEFGKPLPIRDFEGFVEKQRESGDFVNLKSAHDRFVAEDRDTLRQKKIDEEVDRRLKEKLEDYQSQHHIPSDPRPTEPHLLNDSDRLRQEAEKEGAPSGRDAFLETMVAHDGSWKNERS